MVERRQVLRAALLGAAGLATPPALMALASCGVPGGGRAVVDEAAPSAGTGGVDSGGEPPSRSGAASAEDLVQRYLLAVAGPLEEEHLPVLQDSAKRFMTEQFQKQWSPTTRSITVVRVIGSPSHREGSTSTIVTIMLQPVGELTPAASVNPLSGPVPAVKFEFRVVPDPAGDGFRIDDISAQDATLANGMLLSSQALADPTLDLFTPQLIYFWPAADDDLVPDLRYLPVYNGRRGQYTKIVNCLLNGPAGWLQANTVQPTTMKLIGPYVIPPSDGPLKVNLSNAPADAGAFMTQLRWSLLSLYEGPVQLQVNSQPQQVDGSGSDFMKSNLADAAPRSHTAEEYCVAGGVVRPRHADTGAPPVLTSPLNTGVVWAALSRDKRMVAVVRDASGGRLGLWLGEEGSRTGYVQATGLPSGTLGRPAWIPGQRRLLVIVNGRLWEVDLGRPGSASEVTPSGVNQVRAFSIAPDGRRLAMIADGIPTLAALGTAGQTTVVGTSLTRFWSTGFAAGSLSAIAWSRLERLVIAGRVLGTTDSYGMIEMTLDGAYAQSLDVNLADQITHLVAYPLPPSSLNPNMGKILGQAGAGKKAYAFEYTGAFRHLDPVVVPPNPAPSGPSARPLSLAPMAPFFAD